MTRKPEIRGNAETVSKKLTGEIKRKIGKTRLNG